MASRNTNLYSRVLLFSLAALLGITWGAPVNNTAMQSTNCTQQATTLYELLSDSLTIRGSVRFSVDSAIKLQGQFSETVKQNANTTLLTSFGVIDRTGEERNECPEGPDDFDTAVSRGSICSWKYQCNFDPKRIPAFIFTAELLSANKVFTAGQVDYQCKPIYTLLNVLRVNCNSISEDPENAEWELVQEKVTVGYTGVAAP